MLCFEAVTNASSQAILKFLKAIITHSAFQAFMRANEKVKVLYIIYFEYQFEAAMYWSLKDMSIVKIMANNYEMTMS